MYRPTLDDTRKLTAERANSLSKSDLLNFGIPRVADITDIDRIGLPVWITTRPQSGTISINSGKSLDPEMARAGAILEGIEFWAAEHPDNKLTLATWGGALERYKMPPMEALHFCADSLWTPSIHTEWDEVEHMHTGEVYLLPSDSVWMARRLEATQWMFFQFGSNGCAAGFDVIDACLSGLYEVIERDAWTLADWARETTGYMPYRVDCEAAKSPRISQILGLFQHARSIPFLFDITTDLGVQCFWCFLADNSGEGLGIFSGFGCSMNPHIAMERALVEAAQSRLNFLYGARDDLLRRSFWRSRCNDPDLTIKYFESIPIRCAIDDYAQKWWPTAKLELDELLETLEDKGIWNLYCKTLFSNDWVSVARVVALDLEQIRQDGWIPRKRTIDHVKRLLSER